MVEVEGIPLPILKPRLNPPLDRDPIMGIVIDGMGMGMLDILANIKEDTVDIPNGDTCINEHR
jgi:hypothetical protein